MQSYCTTFFLPNKNLPGRSPQRHGYSHMCHPTISGKMSARSCDHVKPLFPHPALQRHWGDTVAMKIYEGKPHLPNCGLGSNFLSGKDDTAFGPLRAKFIVTVESLMMQNASIYFERLAIVL